jgi:PKHD-type hydroxylase
MIITEPRWKSYCVETTKPLFSPKQCQMVIEAGREEPRHNASVGSGKKDGGIVDTKTRTSHISWIPFSKMPEMYRDIETTMKKVNGNHFGFEGMQITEYAQYTEYPSGGFYDWHMDSDINFAHEPTVRKISMTCLLSHESEFEGGELEIEKEKNKVKLVQGQAVFFASFIRHRVAPVTSGVRKSLVMWFGGPPLR